MPLSLREAFIDKPPEIELYVPICEVIDPELNF
jgi:hypothetical protein